MRPEIFSDEPKNIWPLGGQPSLSLLNRRESEGECEAKYRAASRTEY
jgi:hypothetical protein